MTGKQIQDTVNEIITEVQPKDFPHSAINWSDLRCVGVVKTHDMLTRQDDTIEVIISEASSINNDFCAWVESEFTIKTGAVITVRCEW